MNIFDFKASKISKQKIFAKFLLIGNIFVHQKSKKEHASYYVNGTVEERVLDFLKRTRQERVPEILGTANALTIWYFISGCFLFCWIPFFACNTMAAISIKLDNPEWRPGMTTFLITTWLGYINSIVNPFIYTIFNNEFRKAFKKIFHVGNANRRM